MIWTSLIITTLFVVSVQGTEFLLQFNKNWSFDSFFEYYFDANTTIDSAIMKKLGVQQFQMGDHFKGLIGNFDYMMVKDFYYDKGISAISIDRELVLADVQEKAPKHLARLSQRLPLKKSQSLDFIYDPTGGIGVDVYVLDSGINSNHTDFGKRVTKVGDFTKGKQNSKKSQSELEDPVGHGTYVAGVIASQTFGVAKKANLFDVKVSGDKGFTRLSSVISALNLILQNSKITNRPTLVVIPMIMKKNVILNGAVEALVEKGIPVIVPAGNDGKQACNFSPASAKGALTVGAIDVDNDDSIAKFSNWGACVDVFASGVKVETTSNHGNEVVQKTGTSLATGVTAGLVAYFMGMGDTGTQAVERVINYSTPDAIPSSSISFKPLTVNKIVFNCEGHPNW